MILLKPSPDSDGDVPLTWRNYKDATGKVLECNPVIVDANGHYLSIHKHVVDPDGTVHGPPGENSSVVCPVPGCGWHEFVKLEGWSGEM